MHFFTRVKLEMLVENEIIWNNIYLESRVSWRIVDMQVKLQDFSYVCIHDCGICVPNEYSVAQHRVDRAPIMSLIDSYCSGVAMESHEMSATFYLSSHHVMWRV